MAGGYKYSCRTAAETLEWIHAIIEFLKPFSFFLEAHVVNFFKDRLWEAVDKEWTDCLRKESVENLLLIPSGVVQYHWPPSLKEYVLTLRSLAIPREPENLENVLPGLHRHSLSKVLSQGMSPKKMHEIEVLAAVISSTAKNTGANTIVDVGAGQGYLAQVLSFQYQLSVIAIDSCSHHGRITDARAERIHKHYAANMLKSRLEVKGLNVPKTVTCRVMSTEMLKALSNASTFEEDLEQTNLNGDDVGKLSRGGLPDKVHSASDVDTKSSLLLAGLHACGDLSVTMLRTFVECKEVKAVISIGCCYNLLSEEGVKNSDSQCGFPLSKGVRSAGLSLGKLSRDLACQSAERWRTWGEDAGVHNFELHAFRAAFQMVLFQYYPDTLNGSPAIGRQGKALRRQQHRRIRESTLHHENYEYSPSISSLENYKREESLHTATSAATETVKSQGSLDNDTLPNVLSSEGNIVTKESISTEKCSLFEKFCHSGLCRLGLSFQDIDFAKIWEEMEPSVGLIGPYWSLRAALGPVLETILLLDRLLFLQEQENSVEAVMIPIFDPVLSPRNMALIAKKI